MTTKGLYIHIPFCKRKCAYCDFCSSADFDGELTERYIRAVLAEAAEYGRDEKIPIDTLYLGGGTPSLLSLSQLEMLLAGLDKYFDILPDAERTIEVNPGTMTESKARGYKALGFNRVSVGLQSVHENELKKLGRIHTFGDFLHSYAILRHAGFDNISIDLMYGIPEQTRDSFSSTLDTVLSLFPEHISVYGLIVEEGTPFFEQRDMLPLPDEDAECDMYYLAHGKLTSHGYSHYEISNYAQDGHKSRHNLKYWRAEEYIGLGLSAYSYFEGRRYGNGRDMSSYLDGCYMSEDDGAVDNEQAAYEYTMMHLRLSEGIFLSDYEHRFGQKFTDGREQKIEEYIRLGLMDISDGRLFLTHRGFYVSNHILVNIL